MNVHPPGALDPARELAAIAQAVRQLSPSWERPERFHEAKSEIAARLRHLAGLADGQPWLRAPLSRPAPQPRIIRTFEIRVVPLPRHLMRPRRNRFPRPPANTLQLQLSL
jgi:hypothetical protein